MFIVKYFAVRIKTWRVLVQIRISKKRVFIYADAYRLSTRWQCILSTEWCHSPTKSWRKFAGLYFDFEGIWRCSLAID